jgi:ankyrin repeat protein
MSGKSDLVPSKLEVDYDKNITTLYKAITQSKWDEAIEAAKSNRDEARTWVVRHYEEADSNNNNNNNEGGEAKGREIMWRFLPLHSACARQPPTAVISALLEAYPDGARCVDDQGMFALHYACGNQAAREVIRLLLMAYPEAAKMKDPRGMLPIHYVACWGPSSISVVDMVLVANRDVAEARDEDGNTPLDLAREGEYPERDAVLAALKRWLDNATRGKSRSLLHGGPSTRSIDGSSAAPISVPKSPVVAATSLQSIGASGGEEKKQEEPDVNFASVTPRSKAADAAVVDQLNREITDLKQMQKDVDSEWENRYKDQEKNYLAMISQLEDRITLLENEAKYDKFNINELQNQLNEREGDIEKHREVLDRACDERDGLRQTLADLTESHDKFKNKSEILGDRLGSMNASLLTMMEQQDVVLDAMKAREEQWLALSDLRREKLKELVSLEEKETTEELELRTCLMKQTKEMEAIKAVIAAVRQQEDFP